MGIESTHLQYAEYLRQWQRIRATVAGQDAIKGGGEVYLLKPDGMTKDQYAIYLERALFFGATARTVQGLVGAIFRKPPSIEPADNELVNTIVSNVDLTGTPVDVFAATVVEEVLTLGRVGVFTDMDDDGNSYLSFYRAENIRNWRLRDIGNISVPDQFILQESYSVPATDGFGSEGRTRYRILELDENGLYRVTVYQRPEGGGDYLPQEPIYPTIKGKPLEFIPFNIVSPTQLELDVRKSPILGLVDVNLSHYRSMADKKHALHWNACPTPVFSGSFSEEDVSRGMPIGSMNALMLPADAKWGILSAKAEDISAIDADLSKMEGYMAQLGARLLEDQKKAAETAESKRIQYSGENSILASIANTASRALSQNLSWAAMMRGSPDAFIKCKINTDFFDSAMDPAELTALLTAWQSGAISHDTFLYNAQKGEMLPPGRSVDDEKALIAEEMPGLGGMQNDTITGATA